MKNIHYYIVTLVVLLFMVAPAKTGSEAQRLQREIAQNVHLAY